MFMPGFSRFLSVFDILVFLCIVTQWGSAVALKGGIQVKDLHQTSKGTPEGIRVKAVTVTTEERTHILPVQSNGKPSLVDINKLIRKIKKQTNQENQGKSKTPNVNSFNSPVFENLLSQLSNKELDYLTSAADSLQSVVSNIPAATLENLDLLQLIAANVVKNNKLVQEIKQDSSKLKKKNSIRPMAIQPRVSRDQRQGRSNAAERESSDSLPFGITLYRSNKGRDRLVSSQDGKDNGFNSLDVPESYDVRESHPGIAKEMNLINSEPKDYLSSNNKRMISPLKDIKTGLREPEKVESANFVEGNRRNTARRLSLRNQEFPDIPSESFRNRDVASVKEVRQTNTMEKTPHREYVHSSIQTNTWLSRNERNPQIRHSSPQREQVISPTRTLSDTASGVNRQHGTPSILTSNKLPEMYHESPDIFRKEQPPHYMKHSQSTVKTIKYNGKHGEERYQESRNIHSVPLPRNILRTRSDGYASTADMNNNAFIERTHYLGQDSSHLPVEGRWSTLSETGRNSHFQNRQRFSGSGRDITMQQPNKRRSEMFLKSVNHYEPPAVADIHTLERIPNYHSQSPSKAQIQNSRAQRKLIDQQPAHSSFKLSRNQKHQFDNVATNQHYESLHPLGHLENTLQQNHGTNNARHFHRIQQVDRPPPQPKLQTTLQGSYAHDAPTSQTQDAHRNSRVHVQSISPLHAEVHNVLERLASSTKTNSNVNEKAVRNSNIVSSNTLGHRLTGSTGTSQPAMAFQKQAQVIENIPQPQEHVVNSAMAHASTLPIQSLNAHPSPIQKQELARPIPNQPNIPGLKYLSKIPDVQHKTEVSSQAIGYSPREGASQNQLVHANALSYGPQHSNTAQQPVSPNVQTLNLEVLNNNMKQRTSKIQKVIPAIKTDTRPYQIYKSPSVTQNQAPSAHQPLSNTQQPQVILLLPSNEPKHQHVQQSHKTRGTPVHSSTPQQQNQPNIQPLTTNQQNMSPQIYQLPPQQLHQQNQIQTPQTGQQLQTGQQFQSPQTGQSSYIQPPQTQQQRNVVQQPKIAQKHQIPVHLTAQQLIWNYHMLKQHNQIPNQQAIQNNHIQSLLARPLNQQQHSQTVQHHQIQPPQTVQHHQIQLPQTAQRNQIQPPQTAHHHQIQPPQQAQHHQIQPPPVNQQVQIQPPQTAQHHQIQPPQTVQHHQIQLPQTSQRNQIQPPQTAHHHQIQPPQQAQHHQIQPPPISQQFQIQPPQTAQSHQIQPPQTAQHHQIQPPPVSQQFQIQPPQTAQHHQIQPPRTAHHHQIQPPPVSQQFQIQPSQTAQQYIYQPQSNKQYMTQPKQTTQQHIPPLPTHRQQPVQQSQPSLQYQSQSPQTTQQLQVVQSAQQNHKLTSQPHQMQPSVINALMLPPVITQQQQTQTSTNQHQYQSPLSSTTQQQQTHTPTNHQQAHIPTNQYQQPQTSTNKHQYQSPLSTTNQLQQANTNTNQQQQAHTITNQQQQAYIPTNQQQQTHIYTSQLQYKPSPSTNQQQQSHIPTNQQQQSHIPTNQQQQSHIPTNQQQQSHIPTNQQQQSHIPTNQQQQSHIPKNQQQQSHIPTNQQQQSHTPTNQQQQSHTPTNHQQSHIPTNQHHYQSPISSTNQQQQTHISTSQLHYQPLHNTNQHQYQPPPSTNHHLNQQSISKNQQQYQRAPFSTNQHQNQAPPTSSNQQFKPPPYSSNQQFQPPPSSSNQRFQPPPSPSNQQFQPPPSPSNQQFQPPPSPSNQQNQPPPTSSNQQNQPPPTSTNQQFQPPPSSSNQQFQPPSPSTNQQNQPPSPSTNQQNQPPPSPSNQQFKSPHSSTNQQNQPPPSPSNQQFKSPHSSTNQQNQPPPSSSNQQNQPPPPSTNQQNQPPPTTTNQQHQQAVSAFTNSMKVIDINHALEPAHTFVKSSHHNHAPRSITNQANLPTVNNNQQQIQPQNHQAYKKEGRPNKLTPKEAHVSVDIKPSNKFVNFQFTVNAHPEQQNSNHNGSSISSVSRTSVNTATNKHTQSYNSPTSRTFNHHTLEPAGNTQASRRSSKQPAELTLEVPPLPHDVLFKVSVNEHHPGKHEIPPQAQALSQTSSTTLRKAAQHNSQMHPPYNIL